MTDYVRNAWYVAGWTHDLGDKPFAVTIMGEPIVIWRAGEKTVAFEDRCVHRLAPLSLGRCEGEALRCLYHGLKFDADGRCIEIPGQDMIPPQARVRTYPVVLRHSWIWIWMGDAEAADETLIPPAVGLDSPDFILGHGFLDYEAEAQLINENLLDFSHLTYVHANSFQSGPSFAEIQPRIEPLERGIRYTRWVENDPGPQARAGGELSDHYMTYDFLIPGILLMWSAAYPLGTAAALQGSVPDRSKALRGLTHTSQAVTPTGDGKARYFFNWGPHRDHGDEAMRDALMELGGKAFAEDKVMIEAQQKIIAATPDPQIMPTKHDRANTLFARQVQRLIDGETNPQADAA